MVCMTSQGTYAGRWYLGEIGDERLLSILRVELMLGYSSVLCAC